MEDAKIWIGLGVLAGGLTALGIYEHYKSSAAAAGTGTVNVNPSDNNVPRTVSKNGTLNFQLPAGSTGIKGAGSYTPDAVSSSGTVVTITFNGGSPDPVTISWTDSSFQPQQATYNITVV